jgi:hypothetical protein
VWNRIWLLRVVLNSLLFLHAIRRDDLFGQQMSDCFIPPEPKHHFGGAIPAQHCSVPGRGYNRVGRFF